MFSGTDKETGILLEKRTLQPSGNSRTAITSFWLQQWNHFRKLLVRSHIPIPQCFLLLRWLCWQECLWDHDHCKTKSISNKLLKLGPWKFTRSKPQELFDEEDNQRIHIPSLVNLFRTLPPQCLFTLTVCTCLGNSGFFLHLDQNSF